jgi:hypothetical protein
MNKLYGDGITDHKIKGILRTICNIPDYILYFMLD